jgi:cytochrome c-type biogenesis protein CcmH/NrfG
VSAGSKGAQAKRSVPPIAFAVAVIALILLVFGIGYYNLRAPDQPTVPEQHNPLADWIRQKAVESQGDIHKLSPDDQQKLQGPTQGKGELYLKRYYQMYKDSHNK